MYESTKRYRLGELISIKHGFAFASEHYCSHGPFALLTPGNFLEGGGFRWLGEKQKFYDGPVPSEFVLAPGDMLVAMTEQAPGLLGSTFFVPEGRKYLHNQRLGLIRVKKKNCLLDHYLHYYLSLTEVRRKISAESAGTKVKHTSPERLCGIEIMLPPLSLQRKITEILQTWDGAIEKLGLLRRAIIKRRTWLRTEILAGKSRLLGFSGEWRDVALGEVLTEHALRSTGAEEVYSVSVHKGLVNQIEHLGRSFAAKETKHYNRVLPGDIVYTKSPTGDFPLGIIKQSTIDHEVIVSPLYGVFAPATFDLGVILDAHFASPTTVRNYLHPLVQKGAKNTIAITNKRFLEGKLRLPLDIAEQQAVANIVQTDQALFDGVNAEIEALTRQKRGLMQKLLTGEWRVGGEAKNGQLLS